MMIRLNIGAGKTQIPGYTPLDIKDGVDAGKLPYANESVDEVYASHVLEHIPHARTALVLQEWRRVLKPGGVLRVAVPDWNVVRTMDFDDVTDIAPHILAGGHTDEHDVHHAHFTEKLLAGQLQRCGFEDVRRFTPFADDTSQIPASLNLEAFKRAYAKPRDPKVGIILTVGRLGFIDHFRAMSETIRETGWPVIDNQSAFWDKGLSLCIESAISQGFDYLLFTDFDSVFEAKDARAIVDRLHNSDAAATVAVQMSRHDEKPLCFEPDADYSTNDTVKRFAHFGLTAIRTEVFAKMPRPWFESIPGPDGSWLSNPHSDGDISFWRKCQLLGHKVVQCNDIVIGHMELATIWPTAKGRMMQLLPHYRRHGKPPNVEFNAKTYMPKEAVNGTDVHG